MILTINTLRGSILARTVTVTVTATGEERRRWWWWGGEELTRNWEVRSPDVENSTAQSCSRTG